MLLVLWICNSFFDIVGVVFNRKGLFSTPVSVLSASCIQVTLDLVCKGLIMIAEAESRSISKYLIFLNDKHYTANTCSSAIDLTFVLFSIAFQKSNFDYQNICSVLS